MPVHAWKHAHVSVKMNPPSSTEFHICRNNPSCYHLQSAKWTGWDLRTEKGKTSYFLLANRSGWTAHGLLGNSTLSLPCFCLRINYAFQCLRVGHARGRALHWPSTTLHWPALATRSSLLSYRNAGGSPSGTLRLAPVVFEIPW